MARRGSFLSAVNAIVREAERQAKAQERENKRIERELVRLEREQLRAEKIAAKERAEYEKQCAIERVLKELNKAEKNLSEQNSRIENYLLQSKNKQYLFNFNDLYCYNEFKLNKPNLKLFELKFSPIKKEEYQILLCDIKQRNELWKKEIDKEYSKIITIFSKYRKNKFFKISKNIIQKFDIIVGCFLSVLMLLAFCGNILSGITSTETIINLCIMFLIALSNVSPNFYYKKQKMFFFSNKITSILFYFRLLTCFIVVTPLIAFSLNLFEKYFIKKIESKIQFIKSLKENYNKLKIKFIDDCRKWFIEALKTKIKNEENKIHYEQQCNDWEKQKNEFYENQNRLNQNIDNYKKDFESHKKEPVELYFNSIINQIEQPIDYEQKYELFYNEANKLLEISYQLPIYDEFPILSGLSYIKTKNEIKEIYFSESANKKRYEDYIYKLIFSIIAIVFNSDRVNAIGTIVFNGQAENIDRTIGKKVKNCVLSLLMTKEQFDELNLEYIDPKATFKANRGIAGANISELVPVAPIVTYDKNDSRFIEAYNVLDKVNVGTNLASMDWKDFENLIRDIFEKEFSQNGSDVKITQSSRDGGVDVVAFDPDPIRGGKIVIQAKRYTNVVGVSAVRDLYGTLINEGASKGILITTSDYGSDAHNFAKDKPLTLLNGSHLLHLIKKHGQEAYIDLKEAKSILYGE